MVILQFLPSVRQLFVLHFEVSTVQKNGESLPTFCRFNLRWLLRRRSQKHRLTYWLARTITGIFLLCIVVQGSSRRAKINGHPYKAVLGSVLVQFIARYLRQAPLVGRFSIDYGDGSENVILKWIRVVSNFVAFIPKSRAKVSNVGEFPWKWLFGDHS